MVVMSSPLPFYSRQSDALSVRCHLTSCSEFSSADPTAWQVISSTSSIPTTLNFAREVDKELVQLALGQMSFKFNERTKYLIADWSIRLLIQAKTAIESAVDRQCMPLQPKVCSNKIQCQFILSQEQQVFLKSPPAIDAHTLDTFLTIHSSCAIHAMYPKSLNEVQMCIFQANKYDQDLLAPDTYRQQI